jgi:hypothetical protein
VPVYINAAVARDYPQPYLVVSRTRKAKIFMLSFAKTHVHAEPLHFPRE